MESRIQELKTHNKLEQHPEGGWFSECFTSSENIDLRALAGSIYFLLEKDEISHFHKIDCEEIWYFHEGCGMKITVIDENGANDYILGTDIENGAEVMVIIPKDAIFAAKNLDCKAYTFVSCVTTPKFSYDGFSLVGKSEIKKIYPLASEELLSLAYDDNSIYNAN